MLNHPLFLFIVLSFTVVALLIVLYKTYDQLLFCSKFRITFRVDDVPEP